MGQISGEVAYLFRHAVLRDAAYAMQLPSERARLHSFALDLTLLLFGTPPGPEPDSWGELKHVPHLSDVLAGELAWHARNAGDPRRAIFLRRAAEHAARALHHEDAAQFWLECAELCQGGDLAEARRRAAEALLQAGYTTRAEPLLTDALALARRHSDGAREALALTSLARAQVRAAKFEEAVRTTQESMAVHVAAGSRRGEASALGTSAMLHYHTGNVARAIELYRKALAVFIELEDRENEAATLGNLAIIVNEAGNPEEAEQMYSRALDILRALGSPTMEGMLLGNLAVLYALTSREELAVRTYEQALAIHRQTGNRRFEAGVLANLGVRRMRAGNLDSARNDFEAALSMLRETGSRLLEGAHMCSYSLCLLALGDLDAARRNWDEGTRVLRRAGDTAELQRRITNMREYCSERALPAFE